MQGVFRGPGQLNCRFFTTDDPLHPGEMNDFVHIAGTDDCISSLGDDG